MVDIVKMIPTRYCALRIAMSEVVSGGSDHVNGQNTSIFYDFEKRGIEMRKDGNEESGLDYRERFSFWRQILYKT